MSDGIGDVAHSVYQQFDLLEHSVDGARQGAEFVVVQLGGQAVLQVTVNDGRNGLTDAVDPRQQGAAGDEPDQQTGNGQDGDGGGQAVPEVRLQRANSALSLAYQQHVGAKRCDVHEGVSACHGRPSRPGWCSCPAWRAPWWARSADMPGQRT